ncbi:MAG: DegT/DnrJ/EryC1/StrS family aminotransferase [Actinomycetota bacterium]|nr:DegT/DnrJ/EryC1/StrS family aminotransferase [Actinomycetota bacterium]
MTAKIDVFRPSLGEQELAAVGEVFASNWLGYGPRSAAFENAFAAHLGVPAGHSLFINAATSGLFLAMELLGLKRADEVVLPSVSFVAAGNAVATFATPVFCDVDARTLNPTAADVERALTPRTRAVLVLHFGGRPGDIAAIAELCRARGVTLIEDAACAVASRAAGRACGTFGDLGIWSFDAMKILVTGDGGMLWARDEELAERARRLAYYGTVNASGLSQAGSRRRWWDLDVAELGRRLIGNDITAAIGSVQLTRLAGFVERRGEVARRYDEALGGLVETPPPLPEGHRDSNYFYWIQLAADQRDKLAADLLQAGIYTTFRYPALHRVPIYGATHQELPGTDRAADRTLLLPLHQAITDDDVDRIVAVVRRSLSPASIPG